jgi:hypothetical protein
LKGNRESRDERYLANAEIGSSPEFVYEMRIRFPSKRWSALWNGREKEKELGEEETDDRLITFL